MGCIRRFKRENKKSAHKNHVWTAFNSEVIIKFRNFTANTEGKKYVKILKNCKFGIDILQPNGILLLLNNDPKHKSENFS